MSDRLKNLGCVVSEKNLVIYTFNGLDSRFAILAKITRRRETLPTFETTCNMLLLKESSFNDQVGDSTTFETSSSSPTILLASNSSGMKDRCKFIHDHRNRAGLTSKSNSGMFNRNTVYHSPPSNSAFHRYTVTSLPISQPAHYPNNINLPLTHYVYSPKPYNPRETPHLLISFQPTIQLHRSKIVIRNSPTIWPSPVPSSARIPRHSWNCSAHYSSQPTTLPSACSTMTLSYSTWNMDTCASSHLNSNATLLQHLIDFLHRKFDMTDLGRLHLLERAHMVNCNPSRTPVDTESKLGLDGVSVQDPTLYQSLVGGLQYLTFTRLDLSYAVQQICLYMHDPREPHLAAFNRILSTSGYCVFFWDNLLSWSSKRQHTLSRFNTEAEYRGVANVVAETAWLRNLLRDLHSPLSTATLVYCDNVKAYTFHQLQPYLFQPIVIVIGLLVLSPKDQSRICYLP
nr:ribonuclease H-like domain-containing protein [Tanacetum cinerariifolium]